MNFQEVGGRNKRFFFTKTYKPVNASSLTIQDGSQERQDFLTLLAPSCWRQTFMSHFFSKCIESQQGVQKCQMLVKYVFQ